MQRQTKKANKTSKKKNFEARQSPRVIETPGTPLSGIPDSLIVRLRYSDQFDIIPGASYGQYTFRGNSVFDPDYTSTGHQPMYHDTYASLYEKYKVVKSTVRATFINRSATDPASVVIIPHSEVLTLTSYELASETPYAKKTLQIPIAARVTMTILHSMSTSQVLGITHGQFQDEDYSALVSANPVSIWYWNFGAFSFGASNVSVSVTVDFTYDVIYYDRKAPSLSFKVDPEKDHVKRPRDQVLTPIYNQVSFVSPNTNLYGCGPPTQRPPSLSNER
jgi:hypothetical protein